MKYLGLISLDRLQLVPVHQRGDHEYCFHIHDYMVRMLKEAEKTGASSVSVQFDDEEKLEQFKSLADEDVIGALELLGFNIEARKAMSSTITMALFSDFLHFVYEALSALEKRKFTVALSLLRKPFKENLFFAAWLCGDEADFHHAFAKAPDLLMDASQIQPNKRKDIFRKCISKIHNKNMFDAEIIYGLLYDKNLDTGLSNIFDKATHLVTGSRPLLKTEKSNLNFIFKSPSDNDIFENLYEQIGYLLIFSFMVQIELFGRMSKIEALFVKYGELTAIGGYNLAFGEGKLIKNLLNTIFKEFSDCPHCKSKIRFGNYSAMRVLITEMTNCSSCKNDFHFPIFWLLSKVDWQMSDV